MLFDLCLFPIDELSLSGLGAMLGINLHCHIIAFTADNLGLLSKPMSESNAAAQGTRCAVAGQGLLLAMAEAGLQEQSNH